MAPARAARLLRRRRADGADRRPLRPRDAARARLASLRVLAVIARMALTYGENLQILRTRTVEADDRPADRARQPAAARARCRGTRGRRPRDRSLLALFDLNGFKHYNDSFGHPAGDALLARLGDGLQAFAPAAAAPTGWAATSSARCSSAAASPSTVLARAAARAAADGDGFAITASYGYVELPDEASDAPRRCGSPTRACTPTSTARGLGGRAVRRRAPAALVERDPDLGDHVNGVADLAEQVAGRWGCRRRRSSRCGSPPRSTTSARSRSRRDPDKPGPLDADEWAFVRRPR